MWQNVQYSRACTALALWGTLAAYGQIGTAPGPQSGSRTHVIGLLTIQDPSTGNRWQLARNPIHPEAPPRWIQASDRNMDDMLERLGGGSTGKVVARDAARPILIYPGDKLVVEEHSAFVDARLEAVALDAAPRGFELRARLRIGGKVVRVVALERGRAVFAPESESRQ
jgi:hypothetical protein